MKLLITGACGHIGSFISERAHKIKKIKEIILIDNFNTQRYNSLFNLNKKKKFSFYNIDLSKKKLNNFKKVDYLIHCASHTNAQGSFKIKKEMYRNNLSCMKNIINYCLKNKSKLIHLSSTSVYGKQANIVSENDDHLLKPQSPYAEIKLIEENLLKKNRKKLKYITLRLGTISGVSKGIRFHTAINKFCFNASLNEKINIYKTAYNQFRPYLSVKDAFKMFKFCIEKNLFDNETYNVLSGNFTVKQIIEMIKKYKKNVKIKFVNTAIMNQLSYHVSNRKLKKRGINLTSEISQDIKETLKIFKSLKYK
tara:strand:+ start:327 stop:1253 length:927 start_codon:yes stop_codon:yes gene_type:complete